MRLHGNIRRIIGIVLILVAASSHVVASFIGKDENPVISTSFMIALTLVGGWGWLKGPQAGHPFGLKLLTMFTCLMCLHLAYVVVASGAQRFVLGVGLVLVAGIVIDFAKGIKKYGPQWMADQQAGIKRNFFDGDQPPES